MNSRERLLSAVLIAVIVLGAGGFLGWQFVLTPLRKKSDSIRQLHDEIAQLEADKDRVLAEQFEYERVTKKQALPADVNLARFEYARFLEQLLRKSDFPSPSITPREPDNKTAPTVGPKRPAYTKLDFDVQVRGDLLSLVDFLYNFYRQPLLHQIRKIAVVKPSTSRNAPGGGQELDVTFTVEALVLDRSENRPTLLATPPAVVSAAGGAAATAHDRRSVESGKGSPFAADGVLARKANSYAKANSLDEYRRIPAKNIFYGPPPAVPESKEREVVRETDFAPYLVLTRVSHAAGWSHAMVFDRYNKHEYEIDVSPKGEVSVSKWYFIKREENGIAYEVRKKYADGAGEGEYDPRYLQFGSEETGNLHKFVVRRILENEVVIEPYNYERVRAMRTAIPLVLGGAAKLVLPGKLLSWRVGQVLWSEEAGKAPKPYTLSREARAALLRPLDLGEESATAVEEPKGPKKGR
jgi:hypothetical protein